MKTIEERAKLALKQAEKIVKESKDQYSASNAIFGPGAMLSKLFTTKEERTALIKMGVVQQIHDLLGALPVPKAKRAGRKPAADPNGKILVRVPRSIHAALLAESEREGVSLNQLILSKIMLQLQTAFTPARPAAPSRPQSPTPLGSRRLPPGLPCLE